MKNALVVLNYNDFKTTYRLIESVKTYKSLNHIIIVDNNSSDGSVELLENKFLSFSNIDIVKLNSNKGYASGNNQGIYYAIKKYDVDYVLVANPDILFNENIIKIIENELFASDKTAIVAPKVDVGYNSWHLPSFSMSLASLFLFLDKKYGNLVYEINQKLNKVDVVAGSFFAIKSKVFNEIKGFDEETFLYYEENILGFKLKERGYNSYILGDIEYQHKHASTIKKNIKSKLKLLNIKSKSVLVYDRKYLKISLFQLMLFKLCYYISIFERLIWSIISLLKDRIFK